MRRLPALAATLAVAAATLTGCSIPSVSADCPRPTSSSGTPLSAVTVTGDLGKAPTVQVPAPFVADTSSYDDSLTGSGTAIRTPNQLVQLDISLYDGQTGQSVVAGDYGTGTVPIVSLARWTTVIPDLTTLLTCATEGSRVVVALPPGGVAEAAAASVGLDPTVSSIAIIDVDKVYLAKADGSLVFNDAHNLPTVVRAPDGRPGIIVPDADPPSDVVVQTILKGSGPAVQDTDSVRVSYTGVLWATKKQFDTTWDGDPASVTFDKVVPGFADALRGATVGSQVLVVVPPAEGYGDQESGTVPGGSTLVYVIDILGIDPPGTTG